VWTPFTTDGDAHQVLDDPRPMGGSGLAADTCDFWDGLLAAAAAPTAS